MRFDLIDMQLFLHVVEAGSISGGAQRAHLSLTSASERVRGMEEQIGMPLLLRGRRGVEPTPVGRTLVHHARLVVQQMDRMRGEIGEYTDGMKGHVRLLCNTAALSEFLPQALGQFMVKHPTVDIELEERLSHEIINSIRDGVADVGIVADYGDLSGLETYPFRVDRLIVVVAARAACRPPFDGVSSIAFNDLLKHDFIGLTGDSALQRFLSLQAAQLGSQLKMRVRLRSFDAICRMVENDIGIGIIPEQSATRCSNNLDIRCVPLKDDWSLRHLKICVRNYNALPRYTQQLVDHLKPVPLDSSA